MNNSDLFDRKLYKRAALQSLKGNWKVPVLLTLIITLLISCLNIYDLFVSNPTEYSSFSQDGNSFSYEFESHKYSPDFSAGDLIVLLTSIATFLIAGIVEIADAKFYLNLSRFEKPTFSSYINALSLWAKGILETLWTGLFVYLWSLLFLIPGIIKAIAYSQAFYILAEYPEVSVTQALKISQKITKGYKGDLFVMRLSFLGWALLACLTCGIGFLWLNPYVKNANTYAYRFLMKNAIERNRVTYEELHGIKDATNFENFGN